MARFRSPVLAIVIVVGVLAVGDSVWKVVWAVTAICPLAPRTGSYDTRTPLAA